MTPYALIVDDFFEDFESIREFVESCVFTKHFNPPDGITYPCVCPAREFALTQEAGKKLVRIMGARVQIKESVLRLSPKGLEQPYSAHSDSFMGGMFTAIVYLNRPEHCDGGTEFLTHVESGIWKTKSDQPLGELLMRDSNDAEAWRVEMRVPMAANRVLVFPSERIHRPTQSFGTDVKDARMILAVVFDLVAA